MDIEAELRAEAQAKRGKPYDPLARRLSQSQIAAQDNDTAVEEMNREAQLAAERRAESEALRDRIDASWDRIREGRSAT